MRTVFRIETPSLVLRPLATRFRLAQRDMAANTARGPATSSDSGPGTVPLAMPEFPTGGVLWDQYDNAATEPPINIGSQDFEPAGLQLNNALS